MSEPGIIGACVEGNLGKVEALLEDDASRAHARDAYIGSTPLHFASHRGFTEIVRRLLDAGADPNARERCSGTTPLHWAAEGGHVEIASALLERGSALEAGEFWHEETPLGWATVIYHPVGKRGDRGETARLLLSRGARRSIFTAIVTNDPATVRSIVAAAPFALARRLGFASARRTPLHLAAEKADAAMVSLLLDLGADPAATTSESLSPLAMARDESTARELLARGAPDDVSAAIAQGRLADARSMLSRPPGGAAFGPLVAFAARKNLPAAVALLLEHGADPDARVRTLVDEAPADLTPLLGSAMCGYLETARVLLAGGASVNARVFDAGSASALHLAAAAGHESMVRLLVENGADLGSRDARHGATPLSFARHSERDAVAAYLVSKGAPE